MLMHMADEPRMCNRTPIREITPRGAKPWSSFLKLEPFGWPYWHCTFNIFFKTNNLNNLLTKSPHFPLRGQVGQLSKRKRVLCLSIYINSLRGPLTLWLCHQKLRTTFFYDDNFNALNFKALYCSVATQCFEFQSIIL